MDVSVVVPLYKGQKYLENILKNIKANYHYVNSRCKCSMELILVNDYPDEKIVLPEMFVMPLRLITNTENRGIHFSRVKGLECAEGEYLLFLDQDDDIEEAFIYSQLSQAADADVILCNGIWSKTKKIMPDEETIRKVEDEKTYFSTLEDIISPGQALIKRNSIPKAWTKYIMHYNYCDDAFLWLLMKNAGAKFKVNDEILYYHNEEGANTSFNWGQNAKALKEMYQLISDNGLLTEENEIRLRTTVESKVEKHLRYDRIEVGLAKAKKNSEALLRYFVDNNYSKVAIYGYGIFGRKLNNILSEIERNVIYVIDQYLEYIEDQTVKLKHLGDELGYVDVIIVTPICSYDSVRQNIEKYVDYKVVSLEDIIESVMSS